MQPDSEEVAEQRRDYVGGAALAIMATGMVGAAIAKAPRTYRPEAEIGAALIVAVATVCSGVALAGVMRLLSATTASIGQWLRRYSAGVALLAPAALTLTRPFDAGWDIDDCGTLVDRNPRTVAIGANFQRDCEAAAQNRLLHVMVWAAVGCVVVVAYGLRLRWRRRVSWLGSSTSVDE